MKTLIDKEKPSFFSLFQLKCFIACVLLITTFYNSYSQDFKGSLYDKRIMSLETATVFTGDGDSWGIGYKLGHTKTISKRIFIKQTLSSWIVNGTSWIEGSSENQTAIDVSTLIGFSPFKMNKRFLNITGGVCASYIINTSSNSGATYYIGDGGSVSVYNQGFDNGIGLGFTFGLSYQSQISSKLYLVSGASFISHPKYGTAISLISIGLGFDAKQVFK